MLDPKMVHENALKVYDQWKEARDRGDLRMAEDLWTRFRGLCRTYANLTDHKVAA